MEPTIKVVAKMDAFQFLWLKNVKGFDQRYHCYDCLKGERSSLILPNEGRNYPAGFTREGKIEEPGPYAYLCAVTPFSRNYDADVHILMERDKNLEFTYEDETFG